MRIPTALWPGEVASVNRDKLVSLEETYNTQQQANCFRYALSVQCNMLAALDNSFGSQKYDSGPG